MSSNPPEGVDWRHNRRGSFVAVHNLERTNSAMASAGDGLEARMRAAVAAERIVVTGSLAGALGVRNGFRRVPGDSSGARAGPATGTADATAGYKAAVDSVEALQYHLHQLLSKGEIQRRVDGAPRPLVAVTVAARTGAP